MVVVRPDLPKAVLPKTVRPKTPPRRGLAVLLAAAWIFFVAAPPASLSLVREAWIARLDRPEALSQWEDFRNSMRSQAGVKGPVQRKVPKSAEPPLLVWLRDHFTLACTAWLLFGSVLWAALGFFVIGVGTAPAVLGRGSLAEENPGRQRDHEKENDGDAENAEQG